MPKNFSFWLGCLKCHSVGYGKHECVPQAQPRLPRDSSAQVVDATVEVARTRKFKLRATLEVMKSTRNTTSFNYARWYAAWVTRDPQNLKKRHVKRWRASRKVVIREDPKVVRGGNRSRIFCQTLSAKAGAPRSIRVRMRGSRGRDIRLRMFRVLLKRARESGTAVDRNAFAKYVRLDPVEAEKIIVGAEQATTRNSRLGGQAGHDPNRGERLRAASEALRKEWSEEVKAARIKQRAEAREKENERLVRESFIVNRNAGILGSQPGMTPDDYGWGDLFVDFHRWMYGETGGTARFVQPTRRR